MCPVTRTGRTVESGAPGWVSRWRTSNAEWHIMSFSTPPPCSAPCQNQGMWGPLCSSAAPRTARKACRWNRELKPLPMKPTPRRLTGITLPPSPALSRVRDAQLRERLRRAALPLGDERVADVAQVLHAQLARVESRSREIAEAVEEGDARRVLGLRLLRPCD